MGYTYDAENFKEIFEKKFHLAKRIYAKCPSFSGQNRND